MDINLYQELYERTLFLCALGNPRKSSRDLERSIKRAKKDVEATLAAIAGIGFEYVPMTEEEKQEAKEIAKKYGIRPYWLSKELE